MYIWKSRRSKHAVANFWQRGRPFRKRGATETPASQQRRDATNERSTCRVLLRLELLSRDPPKLLPFPRAFSNQALPSLSLSFLSPVNPFNTRPMRGRRQRAERFIAPVYCEASLNRS